MAKTILKVFDAYCLLIFQLQRFLPKKLHFLISYFFLITQNLGIDRKRSFQYSYKIIYLKNQK